MAITPRVPLAQRPHLWQHPGMFEWEHSSDFRKRQIWIFVMWRQNVTFNCKQDNFSRRYKNTLMTLPSYHLHLWMSSMQNDWSYFFKNPWIKEDHESLEAGWQEENDNPEQLQPVLWMSRLQSRMPGCKSNFADVSVFDDLCSCDWWRMLLFLNHEMRCTLQTLLW